MVNHPSVLYTAGKKHENTISALNLHCPASSARREPPESNATTGESVGSPRAGLIQHRTSNPCSGPGR